MKLILCICFFTIIFSLASVSAADFNNETAVVSSCADNSISVENSLSNSIANSNSNNNYDSFPLAFTNLQQEISNANDPVLYLNHDYSNYENICVKINKDIVIDGQGHTINCLSHGGFSSSNGNVFLKNLSIINAQVEKEGGAISISCKAQYTIENCTFLNNNAKSYGGAIYNAGTKPLIINDCTFKSNSGYCGGAIYSYPDVYINHKQINDGCFHSFFLNNVASNCGGAIYSMSNVFATNTKFMTNVADMHASGIYSNKNVSVINCLFDSNKEKISFGEGSGGAICAKYDVIVDNSTFKDNFAENLGGAIFSNNGDVYINYNQSNTQNFNSFFINNKANNAHGGAIFTRAFDGKTYVKNTVFSSNTANVDGGAIYSGRIVDADHCIFNSNKAAGAAIRTCYGGAIRTNNEARINNCSFNDNYAENSGGAIYASKLTLLNTPSYFKGNTADKDKGGAIYTDTFTQNVKYAVFISNSAGKNARISDDGGAIYINDKNDVTFSNCIFKDNTCTDEGGAIYLDSIKSKLTLIHNVFINNKAGDEGQSVFNKGTYGTISDNWWGGNKPTSKNDQLIEWILFGYNVHHVDSKPSSSLPDDLNFLTSSSCKSNTQSSAVVFPTSIIPGINENWGFVISGFNYNTHSSGESFTNSIPFLL